MEFKEIYDLAVQGINQHVAQKREGKHRFLTKWQAPFPNDSLITHGA